MSCFEPLTAYQMIYADYTSEIRFTRPKSGKFKELKVPCGKCLGCKLDKANDWSIRCWCEMQQWKNNCFITLTYDDNHIPQGGYLDKRDVQLFMKKLRYYHEGIEEWTNPITGKKEKPIRFMLCGEYGPNGTRRPHYHLLIFNWKPDKLKFHKENQWGDRIMTSKDIENIWGKGFITVGELTYKSACYVARYTTKKMFNETKIKDLKKAEIQPEFILMSRMPGIGYKYWNDYKTEILNREGILIKLKDKVKNKKIPKYFERKYKEQIGDKNWLKYSDKKQRKAKKTMKEILKNTSMTESEYQQMLKRKLLESAKLLKRNNFY